MLAEEGIRPAINPLSSISRLLPALHNQEYLDVVRTIITILAKLNRDKDILLFGGTPDNELKAALAVEQDLKTLMTQRPEQRGNYQETIRRFREIAAQYEDCLKQ